MADFDSPWKEALDVYFRAFLAFFYPWIHDDIDWSRGFESLDKELQKIAPRSAHGRRFVDKLEGTGNSARSGGEAGVEVLPGARSVRARI